MSQNHEIKVIYLPKNELTETIYIHDDFFCYLWETQPLQYELIENFPVFYPDEIDLDHLDKFQESEPPNKGIGLTDINVLNCYSFEELMLMSGKWRQIIEDLDDHTLDKSDYQFTKDELVSNLGKLTSILKNISLNKIEYILLWEGI